MNDDRNGLLITSADAAVEVAVSRARQAALALQSALTDLCGLGLQVSARIDPGFGEGEVMPSCFFVELDVSPLVTRN